MHPSNAVHLWPTSALANPDACAVPALQQTPFDTDHPLNCNNQADVKKWLAKFIGDGPPPPGSSFQLPDRKDVVPPASFDTKQ